MIMITTRQAPQPERRAGQQTRRVLEHAAEYVFATVNGRYEVHVIQRDDGAWAIRLRDFALHPDGCFWLVLDAARPTGARPTGATPSGTGASETCPRREPTYPLDEAMARTLHALARLTWPRT